MKELPSMWRTELLHPLFVHFPIALLTLSTVVVLLYRLKLIPRWNKGLAFMALALLVPGTLLAWVSVITGVQADNVVGREVCDPTVLEDHERFAYLTAWLFTGVTLLEIALQSWKRSIFDPGRKLRKIFSTLSILLALGGAVSISYVGHLGAKLVYQQAAAVHQPSKDCEEFE